jgi:hypothetical protein
MKITEKLLRIDYHACDSGYQWWLDKGKPSDGIPTLKQLINDNHNDWANWLIVRLMTRENKIKYAVYAAEQVISIYEKKYPNDDRPRKAIQAAKNYLKVKSVKNKKADAADAAATAADAYAAAAAATAADAYAADVYAADTAHAAAAAYAAAAAATAADAYAADVYAADAAYAAAAATAERKKMQIKILKYGMKLISG